MQQNVYASGVCATIGVVGMISILFFEGVKEGLRYYKGNKITNDDNFQVHPSDRIEGLGQTTVTDERGG
jgi:hypothetical protein